MKKTTKALFSLLLVLVMVFQFGAVAPIAWADIDGSKTVTLSLSVDDGDGPYAIASEDVGDWISLPGFAGTVSDLRTNGLTVSPKSGYAVTGIFIAAAALDEPSSALFDSRAVSDEEGQNTVLVFSEDAFASDSAFHDENGAADFYNLYVTLGKVSQSDGVYIVNGEAFQDPACTIPVDDDDDDSGETFKVTFDANGHGTAPAEQTVASGATATAPDPLSAEGFNFLGWYAEANGTTAFDFSAAITANTTVYAKWEEITATTYTVSFSTSVGVGTMEDESVADGAEYTIPACAFTDPTDAKEFDGWLLGEEVKQPGDKITVSGNVALVAQWKDKAAATVTLSFDANGGSGTMEPITVTSGVEYTVPECTFTAPEGKEFNYWSRGDEHLNPDDKDIITANNTLVAEWKDAASQTAESFTVTFDANGHGTAPAAQTVTAGATATEPAALTAEYFTFNGWYADAAGATAFDFTTAITANTTVYAKWTENAPTLIQEGTDTQWVQGSTTGLNIHIAADYATNKDTLTVKIGDTQLDAKDFTVTEGSVVVTVLPAYLSTLAPGTHTITIHFASGHDVTVTVTIVAGAPGVTVLAFAIDAAGFTKVYDGKSFDLTTLFNYITLVNLPAGYKADVEISFEEASITEIHNAGAATLKLHVAGVKDASDIDVSSLFTCEDLTGVPLTITKRKITVETRDDSKVYDGNPWTYTHMSNPQPIMTYTDPKLGEYVRDAKTYVQTISIKYTASPKNMGTYENTAELIIREKEKGSSETGTDITANYEVTYKFGKIKITDSKGNVPASTVPVTGDSNNVWLWVGLMAAAVIIVVVILVMMRKSKKGGEAPSSGVSE